LESYHPYQLPQEVSKTPTTLGTYGSLPKIRKCCFGCLRPLGVKVGKLNSVDAKFRKYSSKFSFSPCKKTLKKKFPQ
jgi:hypothetical protein